MALHNKLISKMKPIVDRSPRISALYRSVRDQLSFMKDSMVTPWGFKLAGNKEMALGIFEPAETEIVRNILRDVDVLVNVGANVGYYCCHALSMGKPVIAFEPMQQNLRYLCRNIKDNGWSGAEIYPIALSNCVDILEMYGADTGASLVKGWAGIPESYMTLVPSATMNLVLGTRLRGKKVLVLIDVEGAEKSILEGASEMIANDPKPVWLIEISVSEHQPKGVTINPYLAETFKCMFDAGYEAVTANREMRQVTMDDVENARNGDLSVFKTHNFLFR